MSVIRRLMLVLTAIGFVLAGALPGTVLAMPVPGAMAMAGSPTQPCGDCPDQAPSGHPGSKMMACGALACAGVVMATPAALALATPLSVGFGYPVETFASQTGVALPPDPFPPRPTYLV